MMSDGCTPPPPCSLTENASRVFLAQFVSDAGAGQPHELGEGRVRPTGAVRERRDKAGDGSIGVAIRRGLKDFWRV